MAEVTRWPPADALEGAEDRLAAGAVTLEESLRLAAGFGHAQQQVLGRDVLVGQPAGLFLGRSITRLARWSRVSWPPRTRAPGGQGSRPARRGSAGRSTPSRRSVSAGTPSSGSTRAARMCSASRIGLSRVSAFCWAATMASWAFWVNRSSLHGGFSLQLEDRRPAGRRRSRKATAAVRASSVQVGWQEHPDRSPGGLRLA